MRDVLINFIQIPRNVVVKAMDRLADILSRLDFNLVLVLPRLDVHHRDSRVNRTKILRGRDRERERITGLD